MIGMPPNDVFSVAIVMQRGQAQSTSRCWRSSRRRAGVGIVLRVQKMPR